MLGYKGFNEINREATQRLKEMGFGKKKKSLHANTEPVAKRLFSDVQEIPRRDMEIRPKLFQGRETAYAEETVEKIVREGFDKSREPIVVWKAPDGKYIVISGHSRWEASKRLYEGGHTELETLPVKIFLGDQDDATDYALLESNREVTQEGLKSDLKAYKRAKQRAYNKEHLKGIFKPESRLRLLEDISYLNEQGSFLSYLGTEAEKSLPYLQRNAQWVGLIRKEIPALNNSHEEELFHYLYGLGEDSATAGKKKITISKEQFFELVNSKVSRIDFDPQRPLNLDNRVSTSALTDPARQEIENIRTEIAGMVKEREKKDELIARATAEQQQELVTKFRQRQGELNQAITRKFLEIQTLEEQIGILERSALDLFSQSEETPIEQKKTTHMETEPETDANTNELPAEPEEVESGTDSSGLFSDTWFKAHPEKILGTVVHTTNQFNRPVTVVKGSLEEALMAINIPTQATETIVENPMENEIKAPLENLLSDPLKKSNLEAVIADTLRQHADKTVNRLKGIKDADACPEEYYCFDDIVANYNKGISPDEIKAWVWYKRKSGGLNDELAILNKKNGWSKYVVSQAEVVAYRDKWLKEGILCYYKGDYIPSVLYYAENINERRKELEQERKEIIRLFGAEQYERQLNGLEQIAPPRLTLTHPLLNQRLFIKPDSAFAESIYINGFADDTKAGRLPTEEKTQLIDAFKSWLNALPKSEFKKTTNRDIISYYLDRKNPPGRFDEEERLRMKQNAKKEGNELFVRFMAEALLPKDREEIEERWNRIYNGYVEINYLKVPVGFTCSSTFKNKPLFIRQAQREGIGFINVHGSGCIAYDVGVGKTMTAILSLAQALEMGQCKRPFIVVPNATYSNWLAELRGKTENGGVILSGLLPQYPINDLYNLNEDYLSLIVNEAGQTQMVPEYSITVLTYEGFNRLCFTDATWNKLGDQLFEILNQGLEDDRDEEKLYEKIKTLMGKGSRGGRVNIEELGLDYMVVDEAHSMKKSFTSVKGEMKDEKRQKATYDLHSGEPSMIALRGFMISQYILQNNNMRNVQLLTATPFTNSPLEIYSILALIAYQELHNWNIHNLKDFFDTFIRTSIELTINAKLKPERKEIVLGFNNLIALQQLIFRFISYKSGEDALIQRPNKIVLPLLNHMVDGHLVPLPAESQISTNLPMTAEQLHLMSHIERFIMGMGSMSHLCNAVGIEDDQPVYKGTELNEAHLSAEEKEKARVLKGLSFSRQITLSPYLFACNYKTPTYREYVETSPKLRYVMSCIRSVKEYHESRNEPVSGQVIYMNAGVQYFPLLKDYLVKVVGYKESEVGIISSGISAAKKEGIKERFQAGDVKIIIGSATIKEGINLQNKSTVLYNCWLDWNPTDVKQLEGRVWRFGNMFANVRIVTPLIEDSIDMFIFQKLEEKTSRINEIWYRAGKENALDLKDFNPSELKMGLVTNPKMLAELMLVNEKENMLDEIARLRNQYAMIESIHGSRERFNELLPYIQKQADEYKPPRAGTSQRAPSTLLKIFREYLSDEAQKPSVKDEVTFSRIASAYNNMQRGLEEVLAPRGLDLNFNENAVLKKIDKEIERLNTRKEEEVGEVAIAEKETEIIRERERRGYQRKTVEERVAEFANMNPSLLSELMVYDNSEEAQEKIQQRIELGKALESSSDDLEELEALVHDLEELDQILTELEQLQVA